MNGLYGGRVFDAFMFAAHQLAGLGGRPEVAGSTVKTAGVRDPSPSLGCTPGERRRCGWRRHWVRENYSGDFPLFAATISAENVTEDLQHIASVIEASQIVDLVSPLIPLIRRHLVHCTVPLRGCRSARMMERAVHASTSKGAV